MTQTYLTIIITASVVLCTFCTHVFLHVYLRNELTFCLQNTVEPLLPVLSQKYHMSQAFSEH